MLEKRRASQYLRRQSGSVGPVRGFGPTSTKSIAPTSTHDRQERLLPSDLLETGGVAGLPTDITSQSLTHSSFHDFVAILNVMKFKLNLLIICVPIGVVSAMCHWNVGLVFWINFLALIPLAALLGKFTEELAIHTGEILGGLLNATFGNAVELIITVQALNRGLITVVQGTLLGSILSNLLLVLGMAFFAGGCIYRHQTFNLQGATSCTSLLLLSCIGLALPTAFHLQSSTSNDDVLHVSRIIALVIGTTYLCFLFFQLYTHSSDFEDSSGGDEESDEASMSFWASLMMLLVITVLVAVNSDHLIDSITGVTKAWRLPQSFIGVILLPIVGNAAEHSTAVSVAMKNKMDLSLGVAVGSSTQIALFGLPFAVLIGWFMDKPMSLDFQPLATIVLVLSVLIVIGVVSDGTSNWLEGVMLMAAYIIIAVVFWYSPFGDTTQNVPDHSS